MSLTCPNCGHSGEFVRFVPDVGMDGPYEDRRCRECGHEYTVHVDNDKDPYPDDWGMEDYPEGGPTCPYCHATTTANQGLASDGDGDLYDDYHCSTCGENFPMNTRWFDDDGIEIYEP